MAVLHDGTVVRPHADRTPKTLKFHHRNYEPILELVRANGYTTMAHVAANLDISEDAAETELRTMAGRGWLHMFAEKDRTVTPAKFIEYRWELPA